MIDQTLVTASDNMHETVAIENVELNIMNCQKAEAVVVNSNNLISPKINLE